MRTLIVGMGEIGTAYYEVLKEHYDCQTKDIEDKEIKGPIDIMHVAIIYSDKFLSIVRDYIQRYSPKIVSILSTTCPGTCEHLGQNVVHSTTRGIHPNLEQGLRTFFKHVGGPKAQEVADYFSKAGIKCWTHDKAKTTELAHILNNWQYGINIMWADEAYKLCRHYGVSFEEAGILYTMTNNDGWRQIDKNKVRTVVTPPNGHVGGHCLVANARLIPYDVRPDSLHKLAGYSKETFRATCSGNCKVKAYD
jgi:UDP-N-acetyl-D-mannosaminuronate dehydrogenase